MYWKNFRKRDNDNVAVATQVNLRTGGFELQHDEDLVNDDATLMDSSIYTNDDHSSAHQQHYGVTSSNTSLGQVAAMVYSPPAWCEDEPLYTDDIQDRINLYHGAVAKFKDNKTTTTRESSSGVLRSNLRKPTYTNAPKIEMTRDRSQLTASTAPSTVAPTPPTLSPILAAKRKLQQKIIGIKSLEYGGNGDSSESSSSQQSPSVLFSENSTKTNKSNSSSSNTKTTISVPRLPIRTSREDMRKPFQHTWEPEQRYSSSDDETTHEPIEHSLSQADLVLADHSSTASAESNVLSFSASDTTVPTGKPVTKPVRNLVPPSILRSRPPPSPRFESKMAFTSEYKERIDVEQQEIPAARSSMEDSDQAIVSPDDFVPNRDWDASSSTSSRARLGAIPLKLDSMIDVDSVSPIKVGDDRSFCDAKTPTTSITSPESFTTAKTHVSSPNYSSHQHDDKSRQDLLGSRTVRHSNSRSSVAFANDVDGSGFEISSNKAKSTTSQSSKSKQNDVTNDTIIEGDDDDSSSSSTFDWHTARCHVEKLHEEPKEEICTGAVRLTTAGLKQHDRKVSVAKSKVIRSDQRSIQNYLQERDSRRWHRERHEEKEKELVQKKQSILSRFHREDKTPVAHNTSQRKLWSNVFRKEHDVADISLAPLNAMEHLQPVSVDIEYDDTKPKKGIFSIFRKKENVAAVSTAKEILARERAVAKDAEVKRQLREQREKERIEVKRRAYIEHLRLMEADKSVAPLQCYSKGPALEKPQPSLQTASTAELSTLSSSFTTMPPCVVCHIEDRTHIAVPCMHFSFCTACALKLSKQEASPTCPVCFEPNIHFNAVSI